MKRLLICLLAICIGYMANAQIQTKFWGLELSKRYTSLTAANSIISDRCSFSTIIDNNIIEANNGTLGGYDWGTICFYFCKDGIYQALYSAGFASRHEYLYEARDKYQKVLNSLTSKYGDGIRINDLGIESKGWIDESRKYLCTLTIVKQDTAWYVTLVYNDQDLVTYYQEQQEDEL